MNRAREFFSSLHRSAPASGLAEYFASLRQRGGVTPDVFARGVREFTRIANLSPAAREVFFGHSFAGLHYNSDLAQQWYQQTSEQLEANQLNSLAPLKWGFAVQGGVRCFVYKGDNLAAALNSFLQGPTVIDCGMFCQLSMWFGIRAMLGDEEFNHLFGNAPFFIIQFCDVRIDNPEKPYLGNPLYPFFNRDDTKGVHTVKIVHIPNHYFYLLKHPGGNLNAQNAIQIGDSLILFDPTAQTTDWQKKNVEQQLYDAFNAPQDIYDSQEITLLAKFDKDRVYPGLGLTYAQLIKYAQDLSGYEITYEQWRAAKKSAPEHFLKFDFKQFIAWYSQMKDDVFCQSSNYVYLLDFQLNVHTLLNERIPAENRTITFEQFSADSLDQYELQETALYFCAKIMSGQPARVALGGNAGIGKTALAVCSAKELSSRGKKVLWLSEVVQNSFLDEAKSMEEILMYRSKIRTWLHDIDVVFLDDDNLVSVAGKILKDELTRWYLFNEAKGLFITSNVKMTLSNEYNEQSVEYRYPLLPGYTTSRYQHTIMRNVLTGQSQRQTPNDLCDLNELPDAMKISRLLAVNAKQSIGIIVSRSSFMCRAIDNVEVIPAFDGRILDQITMSLLKGTGTGPCYMKLTELQKQWLNMIVIKHRGDKSSSESITLVPFTRTTCPIITIEIIESSFNSKKVSTHSIEQLVRVLHFAHDQGNRKVIIINCTHFTHSELFNKIMEQLPVEEKERALARMQNLLCLSSTTYPPEKQLMLLPYVVTQMLFLEHKQHGDSQQKYENTQRRP